MLSIWTSLKFCSLVRADLLSTCASTFNFDKTENLMSGKEIILYQTIQGFSSPT